MHTPERQHPQHSRTAVFSPKEFGAISATLMTGVYLGQALYAPVMSACLATEGGFTTGWKLLCAMRISTYESGAVKGENT